jgi:hypothetical protein
MNYCLDFSLRVEDEILRLMSEKEKREQENPFTAPQERHRDNPFEVDEDYYDQALHTMLQKDQGRTHAAGNIRLGDIILIVDSDTRVVCSSIYLLAYELMTIARDVLVYGSSRDVGMPRCGDCSAHEWCFESGQQYL